MTAWYDLTLPISLLLGVLRYISLSHFQTMYFYRPPPKLREGNVFSRVCLSVCHSLHRGSHVTITLDALDLTIQWPHGTSLYRKPLLVTSGDQYWRLVQTCSPEDPLFWLIMTRSYAASPVVKITVCSRYCDLERHGELRPACVIFCIVQVTLETAVCPIMTFFRWKI